MHCLIGYILTNQISGKRILRSTSRDAYLKNLTGAGKLTDILARAGSNYVIVIEIVIDYAKIV